MTRARLSILGSLLLPVWTACQPPPPRVPVADPPLPQAANTCHVANAWCAYDSDCCSERCESEMGMCR